MGKEKGGLTMREILFEGIKKFAGEIIGILLLAGFIWMFPTVKPIFKEVRKWFDNAEDEIIQVDDESRNVKSSAVTETAKQSANQPERQIEAQQELIAENELIQMKPKPKRVRKLNDTEFLNLCNTGNTERIKEALINGANVNAKDKDGWTSLIWASTNRYNEAAEILIDYGADVNAEDKNGNTSLMRAVTNGYYDTAELLLKHGANPNIANKYGDTALMNAALSGNTEIAELLLKNGADVNAKNKLNQTALVIAAGKGNTRTEDILRVYGGK